MDILQITKKYVNIFYVTSVFLLITRLVEVPMGRFYSCLLNIGVVKFKLCLWPITLLFSPNSLGYINNS